MKRYEVLLRKGDGTTEKATIEAANENDARWIGKKKEGVFEAVVLRRSRQSPDGMVMIGGMIKKMRVSKDISQAALAEKAGLRTATIVDAENGKANLQILTLSKIATALNCYLDISLTPAN